MLLKSTGWPGARIRDATPVQWRHSNPWLLLCFACYLLPSPCRCRGPHDQWISRGCRGANLCTRRGIGWWKCTSTTTTTGRSAMRFRRPARVSRCSKRYERERGKGNGLIISYTLGATGHVLYLAAQVGWCLRPLPTNKIIMILFHYFHAVKGRITRRSTHVCPCSTRCASR